MGALPDKNARISPMRFYIQHDLLLVLEFKKIFFLKYDISWSIR